MAIAIEEIGFDFDGVIADTAAAFIELACSKHGHCGFNLQQITAFELETCLDLPRTLVSEIFTDILTDSLSTDLQPIEGALEGLSDFTRRGTVTIITARPLRQPVIDWLDRYLPTPVCRRLRVVATGDHDDKLRHIRHYGLRYFIDDRAETCRQLAREEIVPFVFRQPWNRDDHDLQTVADWREIRALVGVGEDER
jgi:uncharacterized protein